MLEIITASHHIDIYFHDLPPPWHSPLDGQESASDGSRSTSDVVQLGAVVLLLGTAEGVGGQGAEPGPVVVVEVANSKLEINALFFFSGLNYI